MALLMDPLAVKAQAVRQFVAARLVFSCKEVLNVVADPKFFQEAHQCGPSPKAAADVSIPRFCQNPLGPLQATSGNDIGRARPKTGNHWWLPQGSLPKLWRSGRECSAGCGIAEALRRLAGSCLSRCVVATPRFGAAGKRTVFQSDSLRHWLQAARRRRGGRACGCSILVTGLSAETRHSTVMSRVGVSFLQ